MKIVLFSGGVDSLTTALMLKKKKENFSCIYVDFGAGYTSVEIDKAEALARVLGKGLLIVGMKGVGVFEKENFEIAFRNDLAVISAMWCKADDVYLSIEKGTEKNESKDRSPEFLRKLGKYLSWRESKRVRVINLVGSMTKEDECKWILDNYGECGRIILEDKVFSCYSPVKRGEVYVQCGKCAACMRLFLALEGVGVKRTDWNVEPRETELYKEYRKKTKSGVYNGRRGSQYLKVFGRHDNGDV